MVHLVARAIEVGIKAEVEPGHGAVGDVALDTCLVAAAHVVGHAETDNPAKEGVYFADCLFAVFDVVGGQSHITLYSHRAMGGEIAVPAEVDAVGVPSLEVRIAHLVGILVVETAGGEVLCGRHRSAKGVGEAEVVHALGAVGEPQRGLEVEIGERGVVGEEGIQRIVASVPITTQSQGHGDCLPFVPPAGRGGGLCGAVVLIEKAQEVKPGVRADI